MKWIRERVTAVLDGAAIGDALGGATEGYTPQAIQERYEGRVTGIVPPFHADWQTHRPISPYHKGDGHITDDTLMTQALIQVYASRREHLDAYAIAEDFVPLLMSQVRWIPELERETVVLQRLFLAEKWLVLRLYNGHNDPREAGVGNVVNCGATMYMAPVGIVNAGNPRAAYAEAIDIAGAHQSSYGREAAGVFAAAVAASLDPRATVGQVIDTATALAHDGTREAIEAVVSAARDGGDLPPDALEAHLREAFRPFDSVGEEYRSPGPDARRPSRTKAIEELPIAFGLLVAHQGSYVDSVLGAVNYGRDSDSIATMAGAIAAGLGGSDVIPAAWRDGVRNGSKIDFDHYAELMAEATEEILRHDHQSARAALSGLEALTADAVGR